MNEYKNKIPMIIWMIYGVFLFMFFVVSKEAVDEIMKGNFVKWSCGGGSRYCGPYFALTGPFFILLFIEFLHIATRTTVQIFPDKIIIIEGMFVKKVFFFKNTETIIYDQDKNMLHIKQKEKYRDAYLSLKGFKKNKEQIFKNIRKYRTIQKRNIDW